MEVSQAIHQRRSVRNYSDRTVDETTIRALLEAATLAPSAINEQPWAFAVVQDKRLLKTYSDRAKKLAASHLTSTHADLQKLLRDPAFNIFYNASTLIVICAKPVGQHPDWDCCLAAENLMLAAAGRELGTCTIGFAWPLLEQADVKEQLNIAPELRPVLPIVVGYPVGDTTAVLRRPPQILCWKLAED
jgi:nitroreductase